MRLDLLAVELLHVQRHAGRIVVGPREPREAIDEHEGRHTIGMRRSGDDRHLRRLALRDDRRLARPDGVHHRLEIVHPRLDRDHAAAAAGARHPDAPHVEPEQSRETGERHVELVQQRQLGDRLEVARPFVHEDDVRWALADHLVRDVGSPERTYCVRRVIRRILRASGLGVTGVTLLGCAPVRVARARTQTMRASAPAVRLRSGPQGSAREERKVVTCLFCDLVGFTARSEAMDPEDVRRLLQPYHARVRGELERFGGTVEKFIGDAVMAVFGAPIAHEDDPERAVRAALAIRDSLAADGQLEVRIGITTGEALVALDGRPEAGEGMVSGDVVNTAARLQTAARPGGFSSTSPPCVQPSARSITRKPA